MKAFTLFLGLLMAACWLNTPAFAELPGETYSRYTQAVKNVSDLGDAQGWWTLERINREKDMTLAKLRSKTPVDNVVMGSMQIVGDKATVEVSGATRDGAKLKGKVLMEKVKGQWKISDEKF